MKIKSISPRTTKGMRLDGDVLSGDTYNVRDHIKENWDGKWDASRKVWIVNAAKVIDTISNKTWGIDRILSIETDASQVKPVSPMGNWYFVNKHGQRELSDDF